MIHAARLKARAPSALGDCFAAVTAASHGLTLLTGDPELLALADPPCQLADLRAPQSFSRRHNQAEERPSSPARRPDWPLAAGFPARHWPLASR